MSRPKPQHVATHSQGWGVKREGADRPSTVLPTKEQAIERAREIAKREEGSIVVHKENGQIQEERTYGKDPYPPRG